VTRVLLTGAAGFVGSHVLRHLLVNTDWEVVCPVTFRHRGQGARLTQTMRDHVDQESWHRRVQVVHHDLAAPFTARDLSRAGKDRIDVIMNVASESHVDRSIHEPVPFVRNNVDMMLSVLEYARHADTVRLFLQMSTDEVYGPAPAGHFHGEGEPHRPSNPYSASKSAQESLAFAWWRTYGLPVVVTNTMNIFGETQDPEKFFAKVVRAVVAGETVPVHGRRYPDEYGVVDLAGTWQAGSRMWLHARNLADAWLFLATSELEFPGSVKTDYFPGMDDLARYNVVGQEEVDNLEMARLVAEAVGRPLAYTWEDFHTSRPGHDLRYALDGGRLATLGWTAPVSLRDAIGKTVRWTLEHPEWL
jgi:dTDP-glucose 4,6-dehydratase